MPDTNWEDVWKDRLEGFITPDELSLIRTRSELEAYLNSRFPTSSARGSRTKSQDVLIRETLKQWQRGQHDTLDEELFDLKELKSSSDFVVLDRISRLNKLSSELGLSTTANSRINNLEDIIIRRERARSLTPDEFRALRIRTESSFSRRFDLPLSEASDLFKRLSESETR